MKIISLLFAATSHVFHDQSFETSLDEYDRLLKGLRYEHGTNAHPKVATVLKEVGDLYFDHDKIDAAQTKYEEAIDMMKQLYGNNPDKLMAETCDNLGILYDNKGRLEDSKNLFKDSLNMKFQIYKKEHNLRGKSMLSHTVPTSLSHQDNQIREYEKAYQVYLNSIQAKYEEDQDILKTLHNLATVHTKLGDKQSAKKNYDLALNIMKDLYDATDMDMSRKLDTMAP